MDKLNPDRLFPADPTTRAIARNLYQLVKDLPIISPHGHTDPKWFADNVPFADPASLLLTPDHYVFRMLYSQGIKLEEFGVARVDGGATERDSRKIWRLFAQSLLPVPRHAHAHVVRLGVVERLRRADSADARKCRCDLRPHRRAAAEAGVPSARVVRALQHRGARDHRIAARRPDAPRHHPQERLARAGDHRLPARQCRRSGQRWVSSTTSSRFSELTGEDALSWRGYLAAHRKRRAFFAVMGATSTDHGHPTARTADLSPGRCRGAVHAHREGRGQPGRCGPVPRPDAHRNGAHEPRRQARAADSPGRLAQSQRAAVRSLRRRTSARIFRRAPTTSARCARCSIASATTRRCPSSSSRSTRAPTRASSRRWPATTRR